jgi:polygalacturonase
MYRATITILAAALSAAVAFGADKPVQVRPALPVIPDNRLSLTEFGAVGDGKTMNTEAFAKAMAAVTARGGGRLDVPEGTFLTMPFALTSHLDLHLEAGAVIQFPSDLKSYGLPADPSKATPNQMSDLKTRYPSLISGSDLTDVAITGEGAIDGGGAPWWPLSVKGPGGKPHTPYGNDRPVLLRLTNGKRLHIQGVTIRNSPRYNLAPTLCHDVLIEDVHILAPGKAPNTDAVDPMACDTVLIRNCVLDVGDDNVAIKAIEGPSFNIVVENCRCLHGHGISIGSETYKGIHDVTVRNCSFNGTTNGIRIKSARDRGNQIGNFDFSNITMTDVGTALSINMYYMDKTGQQDRETMDVTASTPVLRHVVVTNVTAVDCTNAGDIIGLPERTIQDVTLNNVKISAVHGMTVQDAEQVNFNNVSIMAREGEGVTSEYAQVNWGK